MKDESFFPQESMPYYLHTPNPPATPLIADVSTYGFPDIVGCAPGTSNDPLFYDSLDTTDSPMLPCHPFCDSEDNLLSCGLGCIE